MLTLREPRRATLVERVSLSYSVLGRFLWCPICGLGGCCQLAAESLSEGSIQTCKPLDKNHRVNIVNPIGLHFPYTKPVFTFIYIALV